MEHGRRSAPTALFAKPILGECQVHLKIGECSISISGRAYAGARAEHVNAVRVFDCETD